MPMRTLLLFLLAAAPVAAQTVHRIAAGSDGHTLELALDGASAGELTVVVAEAPTWLSFAAPRADAVASDGASVATLRFDVDLTAPQNVPADVRLHVVDAAGTVQASHTTRIEAGPPATLSLLPPHPNPAAGAITVRWALPEASAVRVSVFDALGREVRVLADGESAAGGFAARIPAGALATGAYIVRLSTGSETRIARLTVVR